MVGLAIHIKKEVFSVDNFQPFEHVADPDAGGKDLFAPVQRNPDPVVCHLKHKAAMAPVGAEGENASFNPGGDSVLQRVFHQRLQQHVGNRYGKRFRAESPNVALLAAGGARDELQVDSVVLRIQANPQEPHSATADFDLVRLVAQQEVERERWSLSLQFHFLDQIPPDLIAFNPMGIVISYLQGDRAVVSSQQ